MSKYLTIGTTLIILFISVQSKIDTTVNLSDIERQKFNEKTFKLKKRFNVPKRDIT